MKTKTHFAFRVDIWDDTGDSIVEHVAGVDDFEVAEATYRAAILRWPRARITRSLWAPRKIAASRRTPQNCLRLIPLCSRSDSWTFTLGLSAIGGESNFSRCPKKFDGL